RQGSVRRAAPLTLDCRRPLADSGPAPGNRFSMLPEPLTCPYCNARVPVPVAAGSGRRVQCPRCGEPFPWRQPAGGAAPDRNGSPDDSLQPGRSPAPPPTATPWSNRAILRVVLGVMGLMALIGLTYALWTYDFRNRNHQPRRIVRVKKEVGEGWNPLAP